jgi:hypothetical protein
MHERHMQNFETNQNQKFKSEITKTFDFEPIIPEYRQNAIMMEETASKRRLRALQ